MEFTPEEIRAIYDKLCYQVGFDCRWKKDYKTTEQYEKDMALMAKVGLLLRSLDPDLYTDVESDASPLVVLHTEGYLKGWSNEI